MYGCRPRWIASLLVVIFTVSVASSSATAQTSSNDPQQPESPPSSSADPSQKHAQHDMQHMHMDESMYIAPTREGSGTAWLPDDTPIYAVHQQAGAWTLIAHGNAFVQY